MSYISEALKKAEREKSDTQIKPPSADLLGEKGRAKKYRRIWQFTTLMLLLFLAMAGALSYHFPHLPEKKALPIPTPEVGKMYEEAREAQKAGDTHRAEAIYRKIISIDTNHTEALNNLGVIYLMRGEERQAEFLFHRLLTINPRHTYGHYNLACLYAGRGQVAKAISHLKQAASIDERVKAWAREDKDLINLRYDSEFQKLVRSER
ncbi:MAG TPA: tetratricopeptide repeat protein [Syntrophales bacterium]|nr:tetratricopeptide repeat protein [Syntrophales bacterium]HOL58500.1 tetratricopeptide repeat protein [Syntrophales bacterium]HPO34892.1 tetratricopeptide repeat protein [Syntrophales bacterium]